MGMTHMMRAGVVASCLLIGVMTQPFPTSAEWYVAGAGGINFADRINSIAGTGSLAGAAGPFVDFDLRNSITYGAKAGYFLGHGWFGVEGEVLHTTPHIKAFNDDSTTPAFDPVPGIHFRLTTIGANFIVRYPGRTFQPYVGAGAGAAIARIGSTNTVQSDTDVAVAWNVLFGLRAFLTPQIAVFTEYKHTGATLDFDQAFGSAGGFSGNYRAQHILGGLSYHF